MLPRRLAAFAAAMLVSLFLGAADDPTATQLTERASQLIDEKKLDDAQQALAQALEKQPNFAPALTQKARLELALGNDSRESLLKANKLLWQAIESDQTYGPPLILMALVQEKIGNQPQNAQTWYFRGTKQRGSDEAWLVPFHLAYSEKHAPDQVQKYQELLAKAGTADPKALFDAHHKLFQAAMIREDRKKVDDEYAAMVRLQPDEPFIPGDYARGVMISFLDFDAGERYARKALAMRDYPHARQSLSLALYGQWVMAVREGRDPAQVRALLARARANDPDARNVPTCALESPGLKFVADGLQGLYNRNYRDPTLQNC
jgi:tetratricopeptide (TPR) repeat protein